MYIPINSSFERSGTSFGAAFNVSTLAPSGNRGVRACPRNAAASRLSWVDCESGGRTNSSGSLSAMRIASLDRSVLGLRAPRGTVCPARPR